jgi:hypothetical protein
MDKYITNLIVDNIKFRYELELQFVDTDEEKNEINKIISKYNNTSETKIDTFNDKIDQIDNLTMKKLFYRLKEPQKINRLNIYFKNKYNLSDKEAEINSNNIIELLKNDMLKNKDIEYDVENTKIINIKNIDFNEETKLITIITKQSKIKEVKTKKSKTSPKNS